MRKNKQISCAAFALIFCVWTAINCAAQQRNIAGHWEGEIILTEGTLQKKLPIAVDFVKKNNDYTGVLHSAVDRSAAGHLLEAFNYAPPEIGFTVAGEGLQFAGKLDGDTIAGTVKKNEDDGDGGSFTLWRVGKQRKRRH
ncbi:MAG: hypothetical protein ACR2HG_10160 [Pyrinomonadaceae bacterium]